MAAVIAAITAASIAAAVALFRERRMELMNLLVAARVLSTVLTDVSTTLDAAAKRESITPQMAVGFVRDIEGENVIGRVWDEHRAVLAAHLPPPQWQQVATAIRGPRILASLHEDYADQPDRSRILVVGVSHDLRAASSTLARYAKRAGRLRNPGLSLHGPLDPLAREVGQAAVLDIWRARTAELTQVMTGETP